MATYKDDDYASKEGLVEANRLKQHRLVNTPRGAQLLAYLQQVKESITHPVSFASSSGGGYSQGVPKYGALSLFASTVNFFVYDNEALQERFPTAFACGKYVFFSANFLEELKSDGHDSVVFVALHELMHISLLHSYRLKDINPRLANRAMDYVINTRLRIGHEPGGEAEEYRKEVSGGQSNERQIAHFSVGKSVRQGLGFEPGDLKKFGRLSEEDVARLLMNEPQQEQPNSGCGKGSSGSGKPQPGSPSAGSGKGQSDPSASGGGKGKPSDPSGGGGWGDGDDGQSDKILTEDELREIFDELDLHIVDENGKKKALADLLDLAQTQEQADQKSKQTALEVGAKLSESQRAYRDAGIKQHGGHIDGFVSEVLSDIGRPQMSFKVGLRHIMGAAGKRAGFVDDVPSPLYYVDPSDMNMAQSIYLGSSIPQKRTGDVLVLVDTSGSMSEDEIKEAIAELFAVANAEMDDVRIILKWADTTIRGTEILKGHQIAGRSSWNPGGQGGTDFVRCINDAMRDPIVMESQKRGKLAGLLYFSDLGAHAPSREELPSKMPPMAYVATSNATGFSAFRRDVADYAQVLWIEEGAKLDLSKPSGSSGPKF